MTPDLEAMRGLLPAAVPFVGHTGLEYESLAPGAATVVLPDTAPTRNHLGDQHAGALFTAGESASGAAFAAAFADRLAELRPVVATASIVFTAPARGRITARATFAQAVEGLREQLTTAGRIRFDVTVTLSDESGRDVATMTVRWDVRSTPSSGAPDR